MIYPSWSESCTGPHPKYAFKSLKHASPAVWAVFFSFFQNKQLNIVYSTVLRLGFERINAASATECGNRQQISVWSLVYALVAPLQMCAAPQSRP